MILETLFAIGVGVFECTSKRAAARNRIEQWKQNEYNDWMRWFNRCPDTCPPPPIDHWWWNEAIRPKKNDPAFFDSIAFIHYKNAYMEAWKKQQESPKRLSLEGMVRR